MIEADVAHCGQAELIVEFAEMQRAQAVYSTMQ
jgi:hypothetical protein